MSSKLYDFTLMFYISTDFRRFLLGLLASLRSAWLELYILQFFNANGYSSSVGTRLRSSIQLESVFKVLSSLDWEEKRLALFIFLVNFLYLYSADGVLVLLLFDIVSWFLFSGNL